MENFLKFLDTEDCAYEIKDGAVRVLNGFSPSEAPLDNIIIPENTYFSGGLNLKFYNGKIQLPENHLKVDFNFSPHLNTERLPSNLTLGDNCSVFFGNDKSKIKNVTYSENCGYWGRTIFAFWANNDFLISAGCFVGAYSEFEERIKTARYYSKAGATEYKRKVRGCISRLAKKLGKPDPFKKATAN